MHKEAISAQTSRKELGFWLYLMTDCMLFAGLFATYAVLKTATAGGPSTSDLFQPSTALIETLILLTSSFTCGLALLAAKSKNRTLSLWLLAVTYALGSIFLLIELNEFREFIAEGYSWQRSAFLSAFFVLVGTHGLHITAGLIWALTLIVGIVRKGLTKKLVSQLGLFALFWHFLDLIWIFVFTIVYLMGVVK